MRHLLSLLLKDKSPLSPSMQRLYEDDLIGHVLAQEQWDRSEFALITKHRAQFEWWADLGR